MGRYAAETGRQLEPLRLGLLASRAWKILVRADLRHLSEGDARALDKAAQMLEKVFIAEPESLLASGDISYLAGSSTDWYGTIKTARALREEEE